MSVLAKRGLGDSPYELIPVRGGRMSGSVLIDADKGLYSSAMWASIRLRSRLISTMPVDVYRQVGAAQVDVATPPVLAFPGSTAEGMPKSSLREWLSASQVELDRKGNSFGIIRATDAAGNPARIDLQATDSVTMKLVTDKSTNSKSYQYKIGNQTYPASEIWHERLNVVPGIPMGLSPVAYAAWSLGQNQSALQFALDWFSNGAQIPGGHLKNVSKTLQNSEADVIKRRYKDAVSNRDVFVSGNDWEFTTQNVQANESQFLETQKASDVDIARYFDVPADLIDAAPLGKSSLTYANVTQRNLQFLIMSLGPIFVQREDALSTWLPAPRFAKFNTDALLRMDPASRAAMFATQIASKQRVPSETRALDNYAPFTPADIAELDSLGLLTAPTPAQVSIPEETGPAL